MSKNYSPYYGDIIIDKEHQPVVVYTSGKVGSKTVVESIYNIENIPYSIYHLHQLSPDSFSEAEKNIAESEFNSTKRIFSFNVQFSRFFFENKNKFKWKVITLTRDPLAIALSMVFEFLDVGNLKTSYPEFYSSGELKTTLQEFSRLFHDRSFNQMSYVQDWFDIELKSVFGIDVFEYPFDKDKGYSIIQKDNIELLVIRNEDLNKNFEESISEFLGIPDVKLINENIGDNKYYSNVYKFVKENFQLKKEYVNDIYYSIYAGKYVKHFYKDYEIQRFIEKWTKVKNVSSEEYEKYGLNPDNIFEKIDVICKTLKEDNI